MKVNNLNKLFPLNQFKNKKSAALNEIKYVKCYTFKMKLSSQRVIATQKNNKIPSKSPVSATIVVNSLIASRADISYRNPRRYSNEVI